MEVLVRQIADKRGCVPPWAKAVCLSKVRHNGGKGAVGPDLDKLAEEAQRAGVPLEQFVRESIVDPNKYVEKGYPAGVMPPNFGTTLTKQELDAVVHYLVQGSKGGSG